MKSQTVVITYRGAPIPFEYTFVGTKQYVFEITLAESGQILPTLRGMYTFPYPVESDAAQLKTLLFNKTNTFYPVTTENYVSPTLFGTKSNQYPMTAEFYLSPTFYSTTPKTFPMQLEYVAPTPNPREPYYNYNSLLLTGSGTLNGNNNSIIDSSAFANTLFAYSTTTQGSFSPYSTISGYWSVYFGSSGGGYLTVPGSTTDFGTGDYTVEAYINLSLLNTSNATILSNYNTGSNGFRLMVNIATSGGIKVFCGNTEVLARAGAITALNDWHHVAVVRLSGGTTLYVDGIAAATNTDSNNYAIDSSQTAIGASLSGGVYGQFFPGYISNLRVVKGTALYTGNFTPSVIPLQIVSGTTLLALQSNRYRDRGPLAHTIQSFGAAAVSAVSPFLPPVNYSPSAYGGSVSYIDEFNFLYNFNPNTANVLSGNFTMEGWFYFTAGDIVETQAIYTNFEDPQTEGVVFFGKSEDVGGCVSFWAGNASLSVPLLTDSVLPPNNSWTHYAVVKSGTQLTMYKNGQTIDSVVFTEVISQNPGPMFIATHGISPGFYLYKGYMTDFRIVNGTAVYTSDFIPPNAPLSPITNTSLLLGGRNAAIFDSAVKNDVSTNGARIGNISKWGSGSMFFDGTSTITIPATDLYNLSGGTWTIEGWFYLTAVPTAECPVICIGTFGNNNSYYGLSIRPDRSLYSGAARSGATNVSTTAAVVVLNTWAHVAVVMRNRLGSIYVNGILRAGPTGNVTQMNSVSNTLTIGTDPQSTLVSKYTGYIQDLRITKGVARYTTDFTPPGPL